MLNYYYINWKVNCINTYNEIVIVFSMETRQFHEKILKELHDIFSSNIVQSLYRLCGKRYEFYGVNCRWQY